MSTSIATKTATKTLRGIPDIRLFFHRNETPIYFVSATNFNLLGIDEWVRHFRFISYIDCFDGQHPHVISPSEIPHRPFTSIEDINNYLLEHKEVVDLIRKRSQDGKAGKAVFLFFDEQTEELCRQLGLEVCFPPAKLRQEIDSKIMTTRIGDRAGIASVPNVLAKIGSYAELREKTGHLGDDVVIQTAFGDSGHTTFFISNEADWDKHAEEIKSDPEVKVMKKIRCRGSAQEACVTRHGTIVGPLMTELVGFKELTPYRGGWCGNEVFAEAFTQDVRNKACDMTFKFGEELRKLGYRGYFELDFLRDLDTDELYLGEVNPRVTGASAMTNLAAFAHADAPLFLFHLLEWADVDFELDVADLNQRWSDPDNIDNWGQLVIKHTADTVELITSAPESGIWELNDDGSIKYVRMQTHRRTVESEKQGFFLRISKPGDYKYEGADLGILITPGRLMTEDFELNDRARAWTEGIKSHFVSRPVPAAETVVAEQVAEAGNFKLM
ncbi:biotin carboxylase [Novipirellula sp. SH528]|uniref:biotin carboxylase n=1 Tax=Novipirellula sp. SH528 TaxID=3454466 RepID=UPI003FA0E718